MPSALYDFHGKVAVVTGAGRGIGAAIAAAFADASAHVVLSDREAEAVHALAGTLRSAGRSCLAVETDVGDAASVAATFEAAVEAFGRVDILVHSAGMTAPLTLLDTPMEVWDEVVRVNLTGTFLCAQAAAKRMQAQGEGGRIILIGSQVGHQGHLKGHVAYAATKGGVHAMAKTIARTLAPDGVTVNVLAPGITDTPMLRAAHPPAELADLTTGIPLGIGRVEDVAGGALFLASDGAKHITGAVLDVNGGMVMR